MLDYLSTSCFTSQGDVMTMLVAGPNFSEMIPPYVYHDLLKMGCFCRYLVEVTIDKDSRRSLPPSLLTQNSWTPNSLVPIWRQSIVPSANKNNRICDGQARKRANDFCCKRSCSCYLCYRAKCSSDAPAGVAPTLNRSLVFTLL
jgi:hypothetical protein